MNLPATSPAPQGDLPTLGDACIAEALAIIAREGLEKLSLREVARRLGVSHQAPYRHFESRDHLIAEVLRRCFRVLAEAVEARQRSDDPLEDLTAMGTAYLAFAASHPLEYDLMFGNRWPEVTVSQQLIEDSCVAFEELRSTLARLRAAQGKDTGPDAIDRDAMFVWSAMHGLASILRTDAMENLRISDRVRADVPDYIMRLIRSALTPA